MRVLVTGASGMLGRAVADTLAARGEDVTVLQRRPAGTAHREVLGDLADPTAIRSAVLGQDAVIHLAAKVNVVGAWADYQRTNDALVELMDRLAAGCTEQEYARLEEIFVHCSRYELGFWDMAWNLER